MTARVDIWRIPLTESVDIDPAGGALDATERGRAARFHFDRDRRRFRIAHDALRRVLSDYGCGAPDALEFAHNDQGKPYLKGSKIRFNLTHSGDLALLAVSPDAEVGVDLEARRAMDDLMGVARIVFHDEEVAALEEIAGDESRHDGFFSCWTRREAYLKGLGLGLGAAKKLEPVWRPGAGRISPRPGWVVEQSTADAGFCAAVAVAADDVEITLRSR